VGEEEGTEEDQKEKKSQHSQPEHQDLPFCMPEKRIALFHTLSFDEFPKLYPNPKNAISGFWLYQNKQF
jgi:hypothetical protein